MQVTINIKESAYDHIMYLLSRLKDEVTIVNEVSNTSHRESQLSKTTSVSDSDYWQELSTPSLEKVWDNQEDEVYDRFLK